MNRLERDEIFGLLKTKVDVHTLGLTSISSLLSECGYKSLIAPTEVCHALESVKSENNFSKVSRWILENSITRVGFSYRLDPKAAAKYFYELYNQFKTHKLFKEDGGCIRGIFFAGLPDACHFVERELGDRILTFPGDETAIESLKKLGVPDYAIPHDISESSEYDDIRWKFGEKLIEEEKYLSFKQKNHLDYPQAGKENDSFIARLYNCYEKSSLPIIRAHAGPYNPDRKEAISEFLSWSKDLAEAGLLDVLSIGSSQLTQSHFGESWEGLPNGGGVPVNSEFEYSLIREAAKPMLVRTYSGSKNVLQMAKMHERCLNISWHALSLWWFCQTDGRGDNPLLTNLRQHFDTIKYIASSGKPFEPNVPHHFAFRGSDDISYIISAYLAVKLAKKLGIKHLILQNMLNTPKATIGLQDLAKSRALMKLVRPLEDENFHIHLQTRAGLDYFSPDLAKAKIQLAAVTALMDDIEPDNPNSPEIIHVVSYSEAVRLATPPVINESIKITLSALKEYRRLRKSGAVPHMGHDKQLSIRVEELETEARESIDVIETQIPNLYTPEGFNFLFMQGFFPMPGLLDENGNFNKATHWKTGYKKGGIRVVDDFGNIIPTKQRYLSILSSLDNQD